MPAPNLNERAECNGCSGTLPRRLTGQKLQHRLAQTRVSQQALMPTLLQQHQSAVEPGLVDELRLTRGHQRIIRRMHHQPGQLQLVATDIEASDLHADIALDLANERRPGPRRQPKALGKATQHPSSCAGAAMLTAASARSPICSASNTLAPPME